jgi:2-aminoadipate transaminase
MSLALENPQIVSLAAGFVDLKSLPVDATKRAVREILDNESEAQTVLQYGSTIGDLELRRQIVARLENQDGVAEGTYADTIDRTIITTGSAQLIYMVCEALLDEGDIVLVESPTYFVFLGPVETRGARAIRIPIDEEGMKLDVLNSTFEDLERKGLLDRVKLVYSIPEHANPTGISLARSRRGPLVELVKRWSKNHRIFLLEDAAYRGLTFDGSEPPSLWSLDPGRETVIHARTFSKTFSPGLKTGYGVLPKDLVAPIVNLKGNHDFGSSNLNQKILARVLRDGDYEAQIERLVEVYRRKRDVFLGALDEFFGPLRSQVSWTRPKGGLFVWMTVPPEVDTGFEGPLFSRCLSEGVIYVPGEFAFAPEPGPVPKNQMRLSFGVPEEPSLIEGARRLASALKACLNPDG